MFADPIKNLKAFGLKEKDVVADLGAGTGYYSIFAGSLVPKGKVYAIELDQAYVDTIRHKLKEAHIKNVEVIRGDVEKIGGTKIADKTVDAVIASNVLFQLEHQDQFIDEITRILKMDGRVLLVDWRADSIMSKIPPVSQEKALEMFERKGYQLSREIDAGNSHYGMILRKTEKNNKA